MFSIMEAREAAELIRDGDVIGLNSFVGTANPEKIHDAITERFRRTGHPNSLTLVSSAGFGLFDPDRGAENYIREGAVGKIICGHYGSMPSTKRLVLEDRFEAYNLPLGPMSHAMRAQAGGHDGYITKLGLGIFADPRIEGPALNSISHDDTLVKLVEIDGEEYLRYHLPAFDIAIIKATSVDAKGNISFEGEYSTIDALSIAQLTRRNHGKVIVQVDRVKSDFSRPRDVIIPAVLVDAVVVCEPDRDSDAFGTLSVPDVPQKIFFMALSPRQTFKGRIHGLERLVVHRLQRLADVLALLLHRCRFQPVEQIPLCQHLRRFQSKVARNLPKHLRAGHGPLSPARQRGVCRVYACRVG